MKVALALSINGKAFERTMQVKDMAFLNSSD